VTPADTSDALSRRCSELLREAIRTLAGAAADRAIELAAPDERELVAGERGQLVMEASVYLGRLAEPSWRWTNAPD
jgi:hypothetical protein